MNSSDLNHYDQHIASYREGFTPDVEAGLRRLHQRMEVPADQQATVRRLFPWRMLSVAAAILLLVSAGLLVFAGDGATRFNNNTEEPMAFALPDGTKVLLQQGGELSYGTDFNETDRLIDLDGQAYFEVAKSADRPFLVNTFETELRVTGTAFNLRVEDDELEVEVSEGSIELHRAGEVYPVKANECGVAVPGEACKVMTAKNLNRHAWRTGILRFQDVAFADVIETVSNNYGLDVAYPSSCDFPFSGTFSNEDPVSVLQTLAEHGQLEFKVEDEESRRFSLAGSCE